MITDRNTVILNEFTTLSKDLVTLELKGSFSDYLRLGDYLSELENDSIIRSCVDIDKSVYILFFLPSTEWCEKVKQKAKEHNFSRGNLPKKLVKHLAMLTRDKERIHGFLTPYSCLLRSKAVSENSKTPHSGVTKKQRSTMKMINPESVPYGLASQSLASRVYSK
jgi:hypothetical protein